MAGSADLISALRQYRPYNEQEENDRRIMISVLEEDGDSCLYRSGPLYHFTASSWIVNADRTKALMVYHNIYDSWSWTGGHADGESDMLKTSIREAREETGLTSVVPVKEDIFSVEILGVAGHEKNGRYVSPHVHFNVTYLLEADEREKTVPRSGENTAVSWFDIGRVCEVSSEEWMINRIYKKLIDRLQEET